MNSEQLSFAAMRLAQDPALKEVVQAIGNKLTREVMTIGTTAERSQAALLEYHALQRIVAGIDQLAREAITKEATG
jgi:hypothetical protein